jgi:glycosyltransferase involved in cell wall biosynthesis
MKTNLIHIYPTFGNLGGAQKVLLQLQRELGGYVASFDDFKNVHTMYGIGENEFLKLSLFKLFFLKNKIVISHHRKITSLLYIINLLFFRRNKLIHIAHNEFDNLRFLTFLPKNIVAVSNAVKKNLIDFFNIKEQNITVIYNGLPDVESKYIKSNIEIQSPIKKVKIIYAARITPLKQQLKIAQLVSQNGFSNIVIDFAGEGSDEKKLVQYCRKNENCNYIGNINNVSQLFVKYDFLLLYSQKEGLPLSLIESLRAGLPAICNLVGGNAEVIDKTTGYLVDNDEELIKVLGEINSSVSMVKYNNLVINCRNKYLKNFSEQYMLQQYKKYLDEL